MFGSALRFCRMPNVLFWLGPSSLAWAMSSPLRSFHGNLSVVATQQTIEMDGVPEELLLPHHQPRQGFDGACRELLIVLKKQPV